MAHLQCFTWINLFSVHFQPKCYKSLQHSTWSLNSYCSLLGDSCHVCRWLSEENKLFKCCLWITSFRPCWKLHPVIKVCDQPHSQLQQRSCHMKAHRSAMVCSLNLAGKYDINLTSFWCYVVKMLIYCKMWWLWLTSINNASCMHVCKNKLQPVIICIFMIIKRFSKCVFFGALYLPLFIQQVFTTSGAEIPF